MPARNSRAPARLLEAAELLEADQRKHEGGQSKKKKKKKKKIKIERSTSGTIYAQCTLPIDRPRRLTRRTNGERLVGWLFGRSVR